MKSDLHIVLQLLQIQEGQMPSIRRTSMMCPSMSSCERIRSPASTRRDATRRDGTGPTTLDGGRPQGLRRTDIYIYRERESGIDI